MSDTNDAHGWFVYMVRCADQSLYTGITTDVIRRVREHNSGSRLASRYTRSRQPVCLVYQEAVSSRADATRREVEIKRLARVAKEGLILSYRGDD